MSKGPWACGDHLETSPNQEPHTVPEAMGQYTGRSSPSLAFAFHCSNDAPGVPFDHARCTAGYMGRAMGYYRFNHIERSMGMVFKSIGLPPRGRLSAVAARGAWRFLEWRRDKFRRALDTPVSLAA